MCNERQKRLLDYPDSLFANGFPTLEELFRFNAARGEYGPGDAHEQVARRVALLKERKPHVYERTRPNGTVIEVRGVPIEGGGFVTTYFDVTEQRRTQALVAHMAHHDTLTDLPNRALFSDRLQTAVALARRSGLMAVHYLDIDNFKPVNDNLGHKAGDELLVSVAGRLRGTVRDNDTVARLGGDEFAIVQTGIRAHGDAAVLAKRVLGADLDAVPYHRQGRQGRRLDRHRLCPARRPQHRRRAGQGRHGALPQQDGRPRPLQPSSATPAPPDRTGRTMLRRRRT